METPLTRPESELLTAVLDAVPHAVAWKGPDLRYRGCNEAFARFAGIDAPSIVGRTDRELGLFDAELEEQEVVETGRRVSEVEVEFLAPTGEASTVLVSKVPLVDAAGQVDGLVSVLADVTALRRTEDLLAQTWRLEAIGRLAAGIAHEINTPMQYISDNIGFLGKVVDRLLAIIAVAEERLADGPDADAAFCSKVASSRLGYLRERAPKAVAQATEGVTTVARIVSAMKDFSHPGVEEKIPTDVGAAIDSTLTVCRNEWKYVAAVTAEVDPHLPLVPLLPGEFNQVLLNLVVNAAHAIADRFGAETSPERGRIDIRAALTREGTLQVAITDNGCGIPDDALGRVFDHFFTTKEIGRGTGQGLALARQVIVNRHGGDLSVTTEPGAGSTFTITVPLHEPPRSEAG